MNYALLAGLNLVELKRGKNECCNYRGGIRFGNWHASVFRSEKLLMFEKNEKFPVWKK